jgi:hypothetical protein
MVFKRRRGAWICLIACAWAFFAPFSGRAQASLQYGISVTAYDNYSPFNAYNNAPPLPPTTPVAGTATWSQINQNFDAEPQFGLYEDFVIKYEGFITSPISGAVSFYASADDGAKFYFNDSNLINDWYDKGGGGTPSDPVQLTQGVSYPFIFWFYENGGGAFVELYWNIGQGWEIIPATAFTKTAAPPPTTTVPRSLGRPLNVVLSDTGLGINVNWDAAVDDSGVSPERYAVSWVTGNSGWGIPTGNAGDTNALNTEIFIPYALFDSTGGRNAEYTITVRADNDTQAVYSQASEGVTLLIGVNPAPPTTTTTTTTVPEETQPEVVVTTTIPEETSEPVDIPEEITPPLTTISIPETEDEPTIPATTIPEVEVEQTAPTTLPEPTTDEEVEKEALQLEEALSQINEGVLTEDVVDEVVDAILSGNIDAEQIKEAVEALIEAEAISEEVAVELATSPEVIQSLDSEQAAEVFAAVDVETLTDEQAEQIVAAVQNATEEVREAFEEEINVFDGAFDNYVAVGSAVSVGVRRVIVAATAVLSITGVATGTSPQASSRRIK